MEQQQQHIDNCIDDEELPRAVPVQIEASSSSHRSSISRSVGNRTPHSSERNENDISMDVITYPTEDAGSDELNIDCESSSPTTKHRQKRASQQEMTDIDEPTSACRYCLETSLCAFINVVVIMSVWAWVEPVKRLHGIGY